MTDAQKKRFEKLKGKIKAQKDELEKLKKEKK